MNKWIKFFPGLLAVILLAIMIIRIVPNVRYNSDLAKEFTYLESAAGTQVYQYRDHVQMNDMSFGQLDLLLNGEGTLLGTELPNEFELPFDLDYYEKVGNSKVLTLKKGTKIILDRSKESFDLYSLLPGYGFKSYPTYDKGWRYAEAFVKSDDPKGTIQSMYFVKLSDLQKLFNAYAETSEPEVVIQKLFEKNGSGKSYETYKESIINNILYEQTDKALYDAHICNSLDLKKSVFDTVGIVFLIAAGVLMSVSAVLLIKKK